jgi:pyridinium-3,5-biscarboxylic acid mononucleotide synthase
MIEALQTGSISADDAVQRLKRLPFAEVGESLVDHHRSLRQGMAETVYGPGKSPEQVVQVVGELLAGSTEPVLLTRADRSQIIAVTDAHGPAAQAGRTLLWREPLPWRLANVLVVSAGTADQPVVDECALALKAFGFAGSQITDVGVAGLHRLLARLDHITAADAIVVVAGMEGALVSVIAGLTACPVVAVPTSVGYGASLDGVTALLAMLASCASGVSVVGIDNGFGAACAVARMMK